MKLKRTALQFRDHIQSCKPVREVNLLQVAPNLNTFLKDIIVCILLSSQYIFTLLIISTTEKSRHGLNRLGSYLEETLKFFFHDFIR